MVFLLVCPFAGVTHVTAVAGIGQSRGQSRLEDEGVAELYDGCGDVGVKVLVA
jgi:hypothetical protein